MSARDEILGAIPAVLAKTPGDTFTALDVIEELNRRGSGYSANTIRTHVTSRMCANAPDDHARVYDDLLRVSRGTYRLRRGTSETPLLPEEAEEAGRWFDLAVACVQNGNDLADDAELLLANDRVPRAQSLAILAIEEYGKACQAMTVVTSGGDTTERENYKRMHRHHLEKIEAGLLLHALFDAGGASTDHYVEKLRDVVLNSSTRKLSGFYVDDADAVIHKPEDITREAAAETLGVARFIKDRLAHLLANVSNHEHAALMWRWGPQLTSAVRRAIENSSATERQQLAAMRHLISRAVNGEFDPIAAGRN